uniref:Uncharacterized protein n=1 Tax=Romanomermis culicivorax TaxID=13658 RepID=A0A915IJN5_ROMCU
MNMTNFRLYTKILSELSLGLDEASRVPRATPKLPGHVTWYSVTSSWQKPRKLKTGDLDINFAGLARCQGENFHLKVAGKSRGNKRNKVQS